ncbi:UDP-glucose 4-epimerase [Candidatus Sumerlaea chitinivorans]|uniref:UDP-glucose 4-epimerase n=1 Tax=Sumerlaea chitinivorans TaxID=2250252 RepID=A0A2Z4Y7W8_SUMC1|nr:UDP-glucose 4-epimerase [Candidatus Sumerlaea chitinivorans]
MDNFRTGRRENLEGLEVEIIEASVTDGSAVRDAVQGVDVVHHLAALVSVPESMEKPTETEHINVVGTICLLEAAAKAGVQRFVFSSTSAVYGNVEREKHSETDLPAPASPYAISKLAAEYYVMLADGRNGMRTVSLRYFNVFGPRQDPKSPYAAAVSIFTLRALRGEPLVIYGDGLQSRDFIFVEDIVAANLLAAEKGEGVYNVGRGERLSVYHLAEIIRDLTGSTSPIEYAPPRPGDVRHSCANSQRLRSLGWSPAVPLADGLAKTIEWMRDDFAMGGKLS